MSEGFVKVVQLAQQVRSAKAVNHLVEAKVGLPVVMYGYPFELWQDACRLHRFLSPLRMGSVIHRFRRGRHMQPLGLALRAYPAFIEVHHRAVADAVLQGGIGRFQALAGLDYPALHTAV